METVFINYGDDYVQNIVAVLIFILIALSLTSIWFLQHKPIFIGLIGAIFIILMYWIITQAMSLPAEVSFTNVLQIKIINPNFFYNQQVIVFDKTEIIEFQEIKSKGIFYYVVKTKKGNFKLNEPNQRISNVKLIQGFEKLGIQKKSI